MRSTYLLLFSIFCINSFTQSVAQQLGYPSGTKLLIIHTDDIGMSHSENIASYDSYTKGVANSGSIMVPCPWFYEGAAIAKERKNNVDIGVHLTLTSEWKYYRWGPITTDGKTKSLVDSKGYLYDNVEDFVKYAKPKEVEKELRNQIDRALAFGVDVTHLDTHMGSCFGSEALLNIYMKLGKEYKLPVLFHSEINNRLNLKKPVKYEFAADMIHSVGPDAYPDKMEEYYDNVIKNLESGLNVLLIHVAFDDAEMQAATVDHPLWGSKWRQNDFDYFIKPSTKKLIADNKIILVTWKEIRDKLIRK